MTYPNFREKHAESALVTPQRFVAWLEAHGRLDGFVCPEAVLLVYQSSLYRALCERRDAGPAGGRVFANLRLLGDTSNRVGVLGGFGIGAPVAATAVEELVALGVKRLVSIGTAGGLHADISIGDLVVYTGAVRDEGVSHHYTPPDQPAIPNRALTARLATAIERRGVTARQGHTWTIDAPYRETAAEVAHYQEAGVLTVEMETAAIFTVAAVRGIPAAAAFCISDLLSTIDWAPQFGAPPVTSGLRVLADAAIEVLADDHVAAPRVDARR